MNTDTDTAIACMLGSTEMRERLAWIANLNGRALRSSHRADLTLQLDYDPGALADVRRMVEGEQACCAFLDFKVDPSRDRVRVTITAPEEARDAAEMLFDPFATKAVDPARAPSCGCDGGVSR